MRFPEMQPIERSPRLPSGPPTFTTSRVAACINVRCRASDVMVADDDRCFDSRGYLAEAVA